MPKLSSRQRRIRTWFKAFVRELEKEHRANKVLGKHVRRRRKLSIEPWRDNDGWLATVGTVRGSRLSIWLDRYLDPDGDYHLGVWCECTAGKAKVASRKLNVATSRRYGSKDRTQEGFLARASARRELAGFGRYSIDDWGKREVYVGRYVVRSPYLTTTTDVLAPVVRVVRELAEVFSDADSTREDGVTASELKGDETRYRELVNRLARPEQAAFRRRLIVKQRGRCAITGSDELCSLDAVHIAPVAGGGFEKTDNGLLLRSDLHRLFDAGLLTVSHRRRPRVLLADTLATGHYGHLAGRAVLVKLTPGQLKSLKRRNDAWVG